VSGGLSVSVNAEETLDALLESADVALYRAKADGRNRVKRVDQLKPKGSSTTALRVA
jgi:PleD family two-component response regulator